MRLTSLKNHGSRLLMRMAGAPGRTFATIELADEFRLSRDHLARIIQHVIGAGLTDNRPDAPSGWASGIRNSSTEGTPNDDLAPHPEDGNSARGL